MKFAIFMLCWCTGFFFFTLTNIAAGRGTPELQAFVFVINALAVPYFAIMLVREVRKRRRACDSERWSVRWWKEVAGNCQTDLMFRPCNNCRNGKPCQGPIKPFQDRSDEPIPWYDGDAKTRPAHETITLDELAERVAVAVQCLKELHNPDPALRWDDPTWWPAECPHCGWRGMSDKAAGGEPIADTGDYDDPICPACLEREERRVVLEEIPKPRKDQPQ